MGKACEKRKMRNTKENKEGKERRVVLAVAHPSVDLFFIPKGARRLLTRQGRGRSPFSWGCDGRSSEGRDGRHSGAA